MVGKPVKKSGIRSRGFTFLELVFVLAIISVLVSIFLPLGLSSLKKGDEARVRADLQVIASAITQFYVDQVDLPRCTGICSPGPGGADKRAIFLAFGDGIETLVSQYPNAPTGAGNWALSTNDYAFPDVNNAFNHFTINDPNADNLTNQSNDYLLSGRKAWRGPYMTHISTDPWGRAYIAYVGAMTNAGRKVAGATGKQYGWILSAGPNNSLDTAPNSNTLSGDDIGFIFAFE